MRPPGEEQKRKTPDEGCKHPDNLAEEAEAVLQSSCLCLLLMATLPTAEIPSSHFHCSTFISGNKQQWPLLGIVHLLDVLKDTILGLKGELYRHYRQALCKNYTETIDKSFGNIHYSRRLSTSFLIQLLEVNVWKNQKLGPCLRFFGISLII